MGKLKTSISGWGRYPVQSCTLERPERYADLRPDMESVIARGQGRAYGDASLNQNAGVLLTERVNRLLEFDTEHGVLRAEAGATLAEILPVIVPKGWFLTVTPGTKFVSLGGCVAADVHGKNHHHDGSFGKHVHGIELIVADGTRLECSMIENVDLFQATLGGMGLTGIIGEVTLQLIPVQSAYMQVNHHAAANFDELFRLMQDAALDDRYTVAWLDSMAEGENFGRGVLMTGHHACIDELPVGKPPFAAHGKRTRSIPFDFPPWLLNKAGIRAFNNRYFEREGGKRDPFLAHYEPYFYPLDAIGDWNRMYGRRGFVQYQCVIPNDSAFEGTRKVLQALADSGRPSFLAVLKRLGKAGKGMLAFPLPGYTLALDLPLRDDGLFVLLDKLDEIVLQHGGRVYLAKDARMSAASFRLMYPRYAEWLKVKQDIDPDNRFQSSLSRRLDIGGLP